MMLDNKLVRCDLKKKTPKLGWTKLELNVEFESRNEISKALKTINENASACFCIKDNKSITLNTKKLILFFEDPGDAVMIKMIME